MVVHMYRKILSRINDSKELTPVRYNRIVVSMEENISKYIANKIYINIMNVFLFYFLFQ